MNYENLNINFPARADLGMMNYGYSCTVLL